ncbi:MAG: hypothetical protein FWD06_10005 [Oscillospiraceae bacterium]|nr:hypothetical protein [Oscillospiraceae bacterium]
MSKKLLPEDTAIIWNAHPLGKYRDFLYDAVGKDATDSMGDIFTHAGKTLRELVDEIRSNYKAENLTQLLAERRFNHVSEADKAFIIAFDKEMNALGYDCGNRIGGFTVVYGKTGTKSRPCPARIYIKGFGAIVLRLYLNNVDKHREFIESAPKHIKDAFRFKGGDCKSCNTMCAPGKVYTIDGKTMRKCNHSVFYFAEPSLNKLPDIVALLAKFYPPKKAK